MSEELQIYDAIEELAEYVQSCRPVGIMGNGTLRKVDIEVFTDLLANINIVIPEDIRRAKAVLDEAEDIIEKAEKRAEEITHMAETTASGVRERARRAADEMIHAAELEREKLLDEHEITEAAREQAKEMIDQTTQACRDTYEHAKTETGVLLDEAERTLLGSIRAIHSERDRVGVRKMQTRYENASDDDEESTDEPEDTDDTFDDDDDTEEVEAEYDDEEEEERPARRKGKPTKGKGKGKGKGFSLADLTWGHIYGEDSADGAFSDEGSFDEDESDDE